MVIIDRLRCGFALLQIGYRLDTMQTEPST